MHVFVSVYACVLTCIFKYTNSYTLVNINVNVKSMKVSFIKSNNAQQNLEMFVFV